MCDLPKDSQARRWFDLHKTNLVTVVARLHPQGNRGQSLRPGLGVNGRPLGPKSGCEQGERLILRQGDGDGFVDRRDAAGHHLTPSLKFSLPAGRKRLEGPPCRCRSVAQPGSALDWGSRGRRFESCRSDHRRISPKYENDQAGATGWGRAWAIGGRGSSMR